MILGAHVTPITQNNRPTSQSVYFQTNKKPANYQGDTQTIIYIIFFFPIMILFKHIFNILI